MPDSSRRIFVVTDPERGWDCVKGVFAAESEEQVRDFLIKKQGYDVVPEFWDDYNIIHEQTLIEL